MHICEAGNTMYPCIFVIKKMGFVITANEIGHLTATRDGNTFTADSAAGVLGLITMASSRGVDWMCWSGEELKLYETGVIDE